MTEAAQSLGGGWGIVLFRIILPNVRVAILSGAFLSFAIVMGELILAQYLVKPAFAPYMAYLMQQKAYEPAALAIISFPHLGLAGRYPNPGARGARADAGCCRALRMRW